MRTRSVAGTCTWFLAATVLHAAAPATETVAPRREAPDAFSDAPAVVLEHEVDWDLWPGKSSTTVRKRVLIRRDAGSDQADQSIYYARPTSELRDFAARTVQPDGTAVPVPEELRHDLVAFRSGDFEVRVMLFTFPAVRAGSIVEWQYRIDVGELRHSEWWEVQESIPVLAAGFEIRFHGFPDVELSVGPQARVDFGEWCDGPHTPRDSGSVVSRRYTCKHVPAFEPEVLAPPESESRIRLRMSWQPAAAPSLTGHFWEAIGAQWREKIRRLSKKDGNAQQLVDQLSQAGGSETELVDRVYGWVKDHVKVRDFALDDDLERGRGESASVAEILERGGGTPNEVAIATLALLRKAGIKARPVVVGDRARGRLEWDFPDPPSDPRVLLEVTTDGKTGFLDPGCDLCAPGIPDWHYCAGKGSGMRIDLDSGIVSPADVMPVRSTLNLERYRDQIRLQADGAASVEGSVRWFGQHDVTIRRIWVETTPSAREEWLRNRIAGDIEGFEARCSDPSDLRAELLSDYSYTRNDTALAVEGRLLIGAPDVFTPSLALPMQEQRTLPLWWVYPYGVAQEASFMLPDGFELESLPPETRLEGPGLRFQSRWVREENPAHVRWEALLRYDRIALEPREYAEARRFAAELFHSLRRGVVARRREQAPTEARP